MTQKLNGKIALITGGTTGIGFATAKLFAEEGATVIVTGRNPETLEIARQELGERAEVIASDASDPEAIAALFTQIQANHGRLDVVFLNAGIARFAPISDASLEDFDAIFSLNVRGTWLAIQKALPLLQKGSSVVVNTSVVNVKGMPNTSAYAASKAALRSIVRTVAAELSPQGIRVNAVAPGPIETPIYTKLGMPKANIDEFAQQVVSQVPLGRFGAPEELASAVLFLASDDASFVQGVELSVDGGLSQV